MPDHSVPAAYFQQLYTQDPDPWRFASSPYEQAKYASTLAAIGDAPISRGWEVGCSIGVFTKPLASRCATLLAVDVAEAALEQARHRCADMRNISFLRMRVPGEWPEEWFDLIMFSEVLYFLSAADIHLTARKAVASLMPAGRIVLVNWTGETGHGLSGDAAADLFFAAVTSEVRLACQERHPGYRMDIFQRAG